MPGTVLYRKWRPTRFADIVGQEPIIRTLRNAIVQDKIAHAYLFAFPAADSLAALVVAGVSGVSRGLPARAAIDQPASSRR